MKILQEEKESFVKEIEKEVNIAKDALNRVLEMSKGKDNNVAFLAKYERDSLDRIIKCARINLD